MLRWAAVTCGIGAAVGSRHVAMKVEQTDGPIIVIGAGFSGLATSLLLAKGGHDVICVDRLPGPALGNTYMNPALPGSHAVPWHQPQGMGQSSLASWRRVGGLSAWRWVLWSVTRSRSAVRDAYAAAWDMEAYTERAMRYLGVGEECPIGTVHVFRNHQERGWYVGQVRQWAPAALWEHLSTTKMLHWCTKPDDVTTYLDHRGVVDDPYQVSLALWRSCEAAGVRFKFSYNVDHLVKDRTDGSVRVVVPRDGNPPISGVRAVVVSAGDQIPHLARSIGDVVLSAPLHLHVADVPIERSDTPTISGTVCDHCTGHQTPRHWVPLPQHCGGVVRCSTARLGRPGESPRADPAVVSRLTSRLRTRLGQTNEPPPLSTGNSSQTLVLVEWVIIATGSL